MTENSKQTSTICKRSRDDVRFNERRSRCAPGSRRTAFGRPFASTDDAVAASAAAREPGASGEWDEAGESTLSLSSSSSADGRFTTRGAELGEAAAAANGELCAVCYE